MPATPEEVYAFLTGQPLSPEAIQRLREDWHDPDSYLQRELRRHADLAERLSKGDTSWMDLDAIFGEAEESDEDAVPPGT